MYRNERNKKAQGQGSMGDKKANHFPFGQYLLISLLQKLRRELEKRKGLCDLEIFCQ